MSRRRRTAGNTDPSTAVSRGRAGPRNTLPDLLVRGQHLKHQSTLVMNGRDLRVDLVRDQEFGQGSSKVSDASSLVFVTSRVDGP